MMISLRIELRYLIFKFFCLHLVSKVRLSHHASVINGYFQVVVVVRVWRSCSSLQLVVSGRNVVNEAIVDRAISSIRDLELFHRNLERIEVVSVRIIFLYFVTVDNPDGSVF